MKATGKSVAALALALLTVAPALAASRGTPQVGNTPMRSNTAAPTPQALGQPNQSCGSLSAPTTPGSAASAPGSAFNTGGTAGTQYAGQQPQNSNNPAAVSQYDVACSRQPH
jgi:hypothetical protein